VLEQPVDVIVNAANPSMRGGGGVDGAIHKAAGKALLAELKEVAPNGARTSVPVLTKAHDLPHKAILHVAGPVWQGGGSNEANLLGACYKNCLQITAGNGWSSIAFCGISTGIFRFPLRLACEIAITESMKFLEGESSLEEIVFAMFQEPEFREYETQLAARNRG
jgi:O-acetyl-ADP-ribose deacetylase (regulator of RNase III)